MQSPDETLQPVAWVDGEVELLDQTLLPQTYRRVRYASVDCVAQAIREMRVRGAPAIGVTAAYGYALAAWHASDGRLQADLAHAFDVLSHARPTAINLVWALRRMARAYSAVEGRSCPSVRQRLLAEAGAIHVESCRIDREIARLGAELLQSNSRVLTHCNTGPLATAGYGTALGVIRAAHDNGGVSVLVDETRPFLQGARLTAWELQILGVPATVITDSMAGYMMQLGRVDAVIVGADRIAANGDVANKIGTYPLAVLAHEHSIPFYVAAPTSTVDLATATGKDIPIEDRDPSEVLEFRGARVAPEGVAAAHPAFDITPASYITAIITERGVLREPLSTALSKALGGTPAVV